MRSICSLPRPTAARRARIYPYTGIVAALLFLWFHQAPLHAQLPTPTLLGYWHNWEDTNTPYLAIDSLDSRYNVIAVAFALPVSTTDMTMTFVPARGSQQEFMSRIQRVRASGKKVLLSIGGATASIDLSTTANRDAFAASLTTLLTTYGFDGLDVDIEHGASILINGGTITAPQNIAQINLISALRSIMSSYRSAFARKMILTFAPETAYVQGGMSGFGSIWGGYLPLLHALRDSLDAVQVQLYNSGTMYGIDGNIYAQGTADFIVAMTEAVIQGFTTRGGVFTGLPAMKVLVGLPAAPPAAGGGFCDTTTIRAAVKYLRGVGPRAGSYVLARSAGYSDLQGMMTWSVNWDATTTNRTRYQFAQTFRELFGAAVSLPDACVILAPQNNEQLQLNNATVRWRASSPSVTAYRLEVRGDGALWLSDSTITDTSRTVQLPGASIVTLRVCARNSVGWGDWSSVVTVRTVPLPNNVMHISPANNAQLQSNACVFRWHRSAPSVDAYRVRLTALSSGAIFDTTLVDTMLSVSLQANQSYSWSVSAHNLSGWSPWSTPWVCSSVPYPGRVNVIAPMNDTLIVNDTIILTWMSTAPFVNAYHVEVREDGVLTMSDSTSVYSAARYVHASDAARVQWRVRARNESGWGEWSETAWYLRVALPGNVTAVYPPDSAVVSSARIAFSWNAAKPAAQSFEIQIQSDSLLSTVTSADTQTVVLVPAQAAVHRWRVRGVNQAGAGAWTPWRAVTVRDTVAAVHDAAGNSTGCGSVQVFNVFPNPGKGARMISAGQEQMVSIQISDLWGRTVYTAEMEIGLRPQPIPCGNLGPGVYVMRICRCAHILIEE
ncbi:MAG: glycosyl hydrolase family 18 protein [Candidatus Kapaibacterium sp.]|jgi:chitinase